MAAVIFWAVVSFIVAVVGLIIWYALITTAINSSQLAQDMREIKELLQKQAWMDLTASTPESDADADEQCPACGAGVQSTDEECPSCGLALIVPDDDSGEDSEEDNEEDNEADNEEDNDRDNK